MTFHVTSLYGNTYKDQFQMAIIKSSAGEYAILDNHLPIVDHIDIGTIELRKEDNTLYLYVIDATIEFNNHELQIICSDAQIGTSEAEAIRVLKETKESRMQFAKSENIDFSKLEKDLYDFVKKAKSGSLS
jgi:F-type H+-transporting ATPase subunit epsilon